MTFDIKQDLLTRIQSDDGHVMQEPLQLPVTALLVLHPVLHLQMHHLHPSNHTIIIIFFIPVVKPSILQTNGQHLPHPRLTILTAETEAVDLVPELYGVGWIDISSSKVPQVNPNQSS